ncbi:MAG TPA: transglycosylase SLT domain-containing protein [Bryobacteraceae bacterium]|nr:transglycosylase SLT domain-containing protein [Bryobacteraceae bacterium]
MLPLQNTFLALLFTTALPFAQSRGATFAPGHVLPGIGLDRQEMTAATLAIRTEAMIQSQTFSIMREPQAMAGAERIFSPRLQRIFREAERRSGFPASVLQAMAYLESWGVPNAESPSGPRGIMQIAEATGRQMGLRIGYATRHRSVKIRTATRDRHGRVRYRTVRRRETYTVLVRDDRLNPERAVNAAAQYLAGMEQRYGGRDWAIWAYHCGQGCVADFQSVMKGIPELADPPASVARVFFGCSPVWHRELCATLHAQMDRDYSPTYWFRVMRAEQLLRIYRNDPEEFRDLVAEYRYTAAPLVRAPDRLAAWLRPQDLIYTTSAGIRDETMPRLASAPDDEAFFGYRLDWLALSRKDEWRAKALPSTIGTLGYIAFETRRLYAALRPAEPYEPLDVTALVLPKEELATLDGAQGARAVDHASGQVFDLSLAPLPAAERECLEFVLDDLGWNGYLGFIEEPPGRDTLHVGCSPSSRDFFAQVFADMRTAMRERSHPLAAPVTSATPLAP